ncbi:MAG TPA: hypothetical protein VGK67_02580 [Myxococcales bacterium]|jgi:hypothetical protein
MTDPIPSEKPKGVLDRLVDLFRSNPPDKAAEELEQQLKETGPAKKPSQDDTLPKPRYKGVSL